MLKGLILICFFLVLAFQNYFLRRENVKQKDFFIKTLSHDFRVATLAQLRGLEYLSKSANFEPENTELIAEITNSCQYSLEMISTLINSYLFEKGEQVVNREYFPIANILEKVDKIISEKLKEKNLNLHLDVNNLLVNADKDLIQKLIIILLSTVINYSENNSSIRLNSKMENNVWKFSIKYQGKNLSEEECARMFSNNTRFSTVGQGIRMHLCKKIIDFHKGKIFVKNYSPKNNSLTFYIPQKESTLISQSLCFANI